MKQQPRASLTVALRDPDSAVNRFFDMRLPNHDAICRPWQHWLTRKHRSGRYVHIHGSALIGQTFELLLQYQLAAEPPPYPGVLDALGVERRADLLAAFGFTRVEEGCGPVGAEEMAMCYRFANLLDCLRDLEKDGPPNGELLRLIWKRLVEGRIDSSKVAALQNLWHAHRRYGSAELRALGSPILIHPVFAGGFGVGDLLLGSTLIDVKVAQETGEQHVREWLRQIVSCGLCDSNDGGRVESVGIYHAVESSVMTWPLDDLIRVMTATTTDMASLKEEFAGVVATENRSVAQRRA